VDDRPQHRCRPLFILKLTRQEKRTEADERDISPAGVYTKPGTYIHSRPQHIQLIGGTLSECAARERKGGTFHFGNVPGLALTTLGKDTCLFFNRAHLFSSSHHHPSLQTATNVSKCPPTAPTTRSIIPPLTNSSLTSIDRLPYVALVARLWHPNTWVDVYCTRFSRIKSKIPLRYRWNGIRMARVLCMCFIPKSNF
jgi:hypothetical protein